MDFRKNYLPGLSVDAVNNSVNRKIINQKYYPIWASDIHLMLSIYGLESYIYEEKLPKIKGDDAEYSEECIRVFGSNNLFYKKNVNKAMIRNDNKTKWIISNNLDDNNKRKIDFKTKTAYEIWKLIKNNYQKSDEERKMEMKRQLDEMKYDRSEDFLMYLSNMNNVFNSLEELNATVSDELKFNYLYSSLPTDIAQASNMMEHQNDWEECCEHLSKTIPRLKFIREMKHKQNKISSLNAESRKKIYKNNKNIRCYRCNKKGHIAKFCKININKINDEAKSNVFHKRNNYQKNNKNINNNNESNNNEIREEKETNEDNYDSFYASMLAKDYNDYNSEINQQQSSSTETINF